MSKISVYQINQSELALAIQQNASGAAFSGNLVAYALAGGFMGNNVVSTTGGAQSVAGSKSFTSPVGVPYAGTTGETVARLYVDQSIAAASGAVNADAASLSFVSGVSGSLFARDLSISGALQTLISAGGGGGGGAPNAVFTTGTQGITGVKTFVNNPLVAPPTAPSGAANLLYVSGVSGALQTLITAGGGAGAPNSVTTTGTYILVGGYTFSGSPLVAPPTLPSGATNVLYVSGASGALNTQMTNASGFLFARDALISGILNATITGASGALAGGGGGGVINNFYITGTGTFNNTFSASGNITNTFNAVDSLIVGNFVDISFFADPVSTGLNLFEAHVAHSFMFTGAAFACRTSGFGPALGGILSGIIYQVDSNNTQQTLYTFGFQSGVIYSGSPLQSVLVTGRNRVGISITNVLSGIEKFSVGVFGGSYV
jgi:hypothetical protein